MHPAVYVGLLAVGGTIAFWYVFIHAVADTFDDMEHDNRWGRE